MIKGVLIVLLMAGYALVSHFALILPQGKLVAAAMALGIPSLVLMGFAFQQLNTFGKNKSWLSTKAGLRISLALFLAVTPMVLLLWWAWPFVLNNAQAVYFVQHVGTNALLAWVFGRTLLGGATPLVVTFARMVHKTLPLEVEKYARKVTMAWTVFFVVTCVLSTLLFFGAPISAWSVFAVLLQWPSVAAFFVGEYALRRMLFRNFEHASMSDGFHAYQSHQSEMSVLSSVSSKESP